MIEILAILLVVVLTASVAVDVILHNINVRRREKEKRTLTPQAAKPIRQEATKLIWQDGLNFFIPFKNVLYVRNRKAGGCFVHLIDGATIIEIENKSVKEMADQFGEIYGFGLTGGNIIITQGPLPQ